MARAIDGNELKNRIKHMPRTVNPDLVQYSLVQAIIANMPTLTPPNEPLTPNSRLTPKMVSCPKGWQGVRATRFYCPGCKKAVKKGEKYCHKCGQAILFPVERHDKDTNTIWLDFSDHRTPEEDR